jgi:hypothetical protein
MGFGFAAQVTGLRQCERRSNINIISASLNLEFPNNDRNKRAAKKRTCRTVNTIQWLRAQLTRKSSPLPSHMHRHNNSVTCWKLHEPLRCGLYEAIHAVYLTKLFICQMLLNDLEITEAASKNVELRMTRTEPPGVRFAAILEIRQTD